MHTHPRSDASGRLGDHVRRDRLGRAAVRAAGCHFASGPGALERGRHRTISTSRRAAIPWPSSDTVTLISEVSGNTIRHASELGRWEMGARPRPTRAVARTCAATGATTEDTVAFTRDASRATVPTWSRSWGSARRSRYRSRALGTSVRATAFVSGLSDSYAVVDSFGSQRGMQVDMHLAGAFMLTGVPMRELTNRVVEWRTCWAGGTRGCPSACTRRRDGPPGSRSSTSFSLERFGRARPASPWTSAGRGGACARTTGRTAG